MSLPFGVELLGHAAVAIRQKETGATLLIDPYESGGLGGKMRYKPIKVMAGAVVCTHGHEDHSATAHLPGKPVLLEAARVRWGGMEIERVGVWHDEYQGRRRGGRVEMVRVEVGGRVLVHGSDVGCAPSQEVVGALGRVDVLLMPVGGVYTVGAAQAWEWTLRLNPRVVVPMHCKSVACGLALRGVENFLAYFPPYARHLDLEAVPWSATREEEPGPWVVVLAQTHE